MLRSKQVVLKVHSQKQLDSCFILWESLVPIPTAKHNSIWLSIICIDLNYQLMFNHKPSLTWNWNWFVYIHPWFPFPLPKFRNTTSTFLCKVCDFRQIWQLLHFLTINANRQGTSKVDSLTVMFRHSTCVSAHTQFQKWTSPCSRGISRDPQ